MRSSSEGSVSVLYAHGSDICIFIQFFLLTSIFEQKYRQCKASVWGGGGDGGVCQHSIKKIFSSLSQLDKIYF